MHKTRYLSMNYALLSSIYVFLNTFAKSQSHVVPHIDCFAEDVLANSKFHTSYSYKFLQQISLLVSFFHEFPCKPPT